MGQLVEPACIIDYLPKSDDNFEEALVSHMDCCWIFDKICARAVPRNIKSTQVESIIIIDKGSVRWSKVPFSRQQATVHASYQQPNQCQRNDASSKQTTDWIRRASWRSNRSRHGRNVYRNGSVSTNHGSLRQELRAWTSNQWHK